MKSINRVIFKTDSDIKQKKWNLAGVEIIQATHLTENPNTIKQTEGYVISAPEDSVLLPGDKIHFHFNTISDMSRLHDIEHIYFAEQDSIFYAERNGEILMLNDYLLVEKEEQQIVARKTLSGLYIPDSVKTKEYNRGTIKYIGKNEYNLKPEDKIVYCKHIRDGLSLHVNGKDYLRFQIDRVEAIIN